MSKLANLASPVKESVCVVAIGPGLQLIEDDDFDMATSARYQVVDVVTEEVLDCSDLLSVARHQLAIHTERRRPVREIEVAPPLASDGRDEDGDADAEINRYLIARGMAEMLQSEPELGEMLW